MPIHAPPKPVVKWAGGKQALLPQLLEHFPARFETYHEPFLGGASVALAVGAKRARLSDANAWLIDTYRAIRDDWRAVAAVLEELPNTKEEFLAIRAQPHAHLPLAKRAAHFVYLNKTCFRGLFRVNRAGRFNVPYGAYHRRYYDPANWEAVSRALQGAELCCADYAQALSVAQAGDFVYLDPPYWKLGGYADFNRYTPGQFRAEDHVRLAESCRDLAARGVRWALSNSDTEEVRELYRGFRVVEVAARREINLNAGSRDVRELLILGW
ncbi:MAG: Dam family site-specific DNA-(adenine-N6)-methyltransferase [Planctomycetes bacterium]|nr:Dam family site-specific DNA-(adenine-N6)-methyltransferase [Planctomycetota bacterium]